MLAPIATDTGQLPPVWGKEVFEALVHNLYSHPNDQATGGLLGLVVCVRLAVGFSCCLHFIQCLLSETVPSHLVAAAAQWLCADEHLLYKCIGHHLFVMFLCRPTLGQQCASVFNIVAANTALSTSVAFNSLSVLKDVTNTGACSHNKGKGKNKAINSSISDTFDNWASTLDDSEASASDPCTVTLASNWVFSKVIHACELNVPFDKKTPLVSVHEGAVQQAAGDLGVCGRGIQCSCLFP
ncbi:hypothetical protein B0H14DRAFT_2603835 [Mycena olivaceomarginata]|nr:hypothetical protein B0H14DRAFT_2603835 [Mycena olivaceomarginata]